MFDKIFISGYWEHYLNDQNLHHEIKELDNL